MRRQREVSVQAEQDDILPPSSPEPDEGTRPIQDDDEEEEEEV
jgi:hypothetical protein